MGFHRKWSRGRGRGAFGTLVRQGFTGPRLPGLANHYLLPTTSGWADRMGGVNATHVGSPSLATDGPRCAPVGMVYNGSSQYSTFGDAATVAFIHQTGIFGIAVTFRWAGPASGGLHSLFAAALGAATKGPSIFIDDGGGTKGPRMLSAQLARGSAPTLNRLDSSTNALVVGQLHQAIMTCDGVTVRLLLDGVEVDSEPVIATATGDSSYAPRIGDVEAASPTFVFPGEIYDVKIGTADWSAYAARLWAEVPFG